jgi:hypothetical protein
MYPTNGGKRVWNLYFSCPDIDKRLLVITNMDNNADDKMYNRRNADICGLPFVFPIGS